MSPSQSPRRPRVATSGGRREMHVRSGIRPRPSPPWRRLRRPPCRRNARKCPACSKSECRRAIDRLVRDPALGTLRLLHLQPPGDLLGRPALRQSAPHVLLHLGPVELADQRPLPPPLLGPPLRFQGRVLSSRAVAPQLPGDRALVPAQCLGDRRRTRSGVTHLADDFPLLSGKMAVRHRKVPGLMSGVVTDYQTTLRCPFNLQHRCTSDVNPPSKNCDPHARPCQTCQPACDVAIARISIQSSRTGRSGRA